MTARVSSAPESIDRNPGNHDGKGSLKRRNHLARKPVDRNPGNHDSKGNLERRNRYTGTEIMTAKGMRRNQ